MSDNNLAAEAGYYWRVASEARRIRRETPNHPTIEQEDDLAGIVINSDWPRLKAAASAVQAELNGTLVAAEQDQVACESSA